MFMGFNIWELVLFIVAIIVVGLMIIPTKVEEEKPQSKRIRMIFSLLNRCHVVERKDAYIKFYCKRYIDATNYASMLQDMGISSIVKDHYITVCTGEG